MRSATWLKDVKAFVKQELTEFLNMADADCAADNHFDPPWVQERHRQSQFRLMSVQQLLCGMVENEFIDIEPKMRDHLQQRHSRIIQS